MGVLTNLLTKLGSYDRAKEISGYEKLSAEKKKKDKKPRWMEAAPAVGAIVGGAYGAAKPGSALGGSLKGKSVKTRIAGALMGAGIGATTGWLPDVLRSGAKAIKGD